MSAPLSNLANYLKALYSSMWLTWKGSPILGWLKPDYTNWWTKLHRNYLVVTQPKEQDLLCRALASDWSSTRPHFTTPLLFILRLEEIVAVIDPEEVDEENFVKSLSKVLFIDEEGQDCVRAYLKVQYSIALVLSSQSPELWLDPRAISLLAWLDSHRVPLLLLSEGTLPELKINAVRKDLHGFSGSTAIRYWMSLFPPDTPPVPATNHFQYFSASLRFFDPDTMYLFCEYVLDDPDLLHQDNILFFIRDLFEKVVNRYLDLIPVEGFSKDAQRLMQIASKIAFTTSSSENQFFDVEGAQKMISEEDNLFFPSLSHFVENCSIFIPTKKKDQELIRFQANFRGYLTARHVFDEFRNSEDISELKNYVQQKRHSNFTRITFVWLARVIHVECPEILSEIFAILYAEPRSDNLRREMQLWIQTLEATDCSVGPENLAKVSEIVKEEVMSMLTNDKEVHYDSDRWLAAFKRTPSIVDMLGVIPMLEEFVNTWVEDPEGADDPSRVVQYTKVGLLLSSLPSSTSPPSSPLLLPSRSSSPLLSPLPPPAPFLFSLLSALPPSSLSPPYPLGMLESTMTLILKLPPRALTGSWVIPAFSHVISLPWAQQQLLQKIKECPCKEILDLCKSGPKFFLHTIASRRHVEELVYRIYCTPEESLETAKFFAPYTSRPEVIRIFWRLVGMSKIADRMIIPLLKQQIAQQGGGMLLNSFCHFLSELTTPERLYPAFKEFVGNNKIPFSNQNERSHVLLLASEKAYDHNFLSNIVLRKFRYARPESWAKIFALRYAKKLPGYTGVHLFEPGDLELIFRVWIEKGPEKRLATLEYLPHFLWPVKHVHEKSATYKCWDKIKFAHPEPANILPDILSHIFTFLESRWLRKASYTCTSWFRVGAKILSKQWESAESVGKEAVLASLRMATPIRAGRKYIHPAFATEEFFREILDRGIPSAQLLEYFITSGIPVTREDVALGLKKILARSRVASVSSVIKLFVEFELTENSELMRQFVKKCELQGYPPIESAEELLATGNRKFLDRTLLEIEKKQGESLRSLMIDAVIRNCPGARLEVAEFVSTSVFEISEISENLLDERAQFFKSVEAPSGITCTYFLGIAGKCAPKFIRKCIEIFKNMELSDTDRTNIFTCLLTRWNLTIRKPGPDYLEFCHAVFSGIYDGFLEIPKSTRLEISRLFLRKKVFVSEYTRDFFLQESLDSVESAGDFLNYVKFILYDGSATEEKLRAIEESPYFESSKQNILEMMSELVRGPKLEVPYPLFFSFSSKHGSLEETRYFFETAATDLRWKFHETPELAMEFLDVLYFKFFPVFPDSTWPALSKFLYRGVKPVSKVRKELRERILEWMREKREELPPSTKFLVAIGEDTQEKERREERRKEKWEGGRAAREEGEAGAGGSRTRSVEGGGGGEEGESEEILEVVGMEEGEEERGAGVRTPEEEGGKRGAEVKGDQQEEEGARDRKEGGDGDEETGAGVRTQEAPEEEGEGREDEMEGTEERKEEGREGEEEGREHTGLRLTRDSGQEEGTEDRKEEGREEEKGEDARLRDYEQEERIEERKEEGGEGPRGGK